MVTGDNLHTAQQIARDCGLLKQGGTMEGPAFRALDPGALGTRLDGLEVRLMGAICTKYVLHQKRSLSYTLSRCWPGQRPQTSTRW